MKNNDIKIKNSSSSLSEFVKRPLASDEEVAAFDKYVADEAKEKEVKDSLAKIYQDDKGNQVDIKTLTVKRGRGFFSNLFIFAFVMFVLAGAAYAAYNYIYLKINAPKQPVNLSIEAVREVAAGEEFYYQVNYKNEDNVAINNIEIKVKFPDSFIFLSSDPSPSRNNNFWEIPSLSAHRSDTIKIKGRLVAPEGQSDIILAEMTYRPENFSSEFKKSAVQQTKINDLGLDFSLVSSGNALVNEDNDIIIKFKAKAENYLNNFRLSLVYPPEVEIINPPADKPEAATSTPAVPKIESSGPGAWQFSNLGKNENQFTVKFKVKEKKQPTVDLSLKFELPAATPDGAMEYYLFYQKDLTYEVIKSDFNIGVIINGSPLDQAVNFGQTLNYAISYANKGEALMKDVIIMAVLESDFLDWQTLADKNNGKVSGNTLSWSKTEIPALAEMPSGAEETIDFSIRLKPSAVIDPGKLYQVKSYVKYSLAGKSAGGESQSNAIINKINSDLNLSEQLRYFSDDNLAVGSGPLPPKAGQTTSLKVYWTINNNLHELDDLVISFNLPANVTWDDKSRSSVGAVSFDSQANKVVWQIGRLPVVVYKADAEFNLSITPAESDRNKIMVILPGTSIAALDKVTGMAINKTLKAKTSKLEDDNMASGDGVVQ
ncbi:hypothetical protein A3H66_00840 [Candidatus Falkowbacteria bacterium RIFCSPLOWO2_02_FULL_45_21]|uniref:DUF11 domain-containing protein n=1 Tax=Candidatus Falkowbacteria bacterium RIFCSPLOWO2_02_FULL_45_21 TaxID=1797989 RepID=A0A1F5SBG2_9BACT|nr:MAG: hypothetical protein A3H66_00840 [Candidatus Falkowbacteria bacterium RIFCSPLOWO2_02_FULL_45_21]